MKEKIGQPLSVFKIAGTYIGTVVGAGFASGQEILQFFTAHGLLGLAGIAVSSLLFFFVGYTILILGRNLKAPSHVAVVLHTNGRAVGVFIDIIITIFLFGGLAAMISGAGAIFREQLSLSPMSGMLIMAAASALTVITGTKGVVSAISYVVPFLFFSLLSIAAYSFFNNPVSGAELRAAEAMRGAAPNWLVSAVNYASYNTVVSIAVLAPIGAAAESKKKLLAGALVGAAVLGICMAAVYFCILTNIIEVRATEIPLLEIAGGISGLIKLPFALVLFCEIYTTAVGNLFGFAQRIYPAGRRPAFVAAVSVLALVAAQFGFSNMVKYFYPVIGYGGIAFFIGVICVWILKRNSVR